MLAHTQVDSTAGTFDFGQRVVHMRCAAVDAIDGAWCGIELGGDFFRQHARLAGEAADAPDERFVAAYIEPQADCRATQGREKMALERVVCREERCTASCC